MADNTTSPAPNVGRAAFTFILIMVAFDFLAFSVSSCRCSCSCWPSMWRGQMNPPSRVLKPPPVSIPPS